MRKLKLARQRRKNKFKNLENVQEAKNKAINVSDKGTKSVNKKDKQMKKREIFKDRFLIEHRKEKQELAKYRRGINNTEKRRLEEDNENDDVEIKQLEKKLKLDKRKGNGLQKAFVSDGLDYLLDFCNEEQRKIAVRTEKHLLGAVSESDSDDAPLEKKSQGGKKKSNLKVKSKTALSKHSEEEGSSDEEDSAVEGDFSEEGKDSDVEDDFEEENDFDEEGSSETGEDNIEESDEDNSGDEPIGKMIRLKNDKKKSALKQNQFDSEEEIEDEEVECSDMDQAEEIGSEGENSEKRKNVAKKNDDGTWEDIYGRKRNASGNIITENVGKYVPPGARLKQSGDGARNEKFLQLKRQLKGLMNRLSENNMHSISSQIEQLYMSNSRNDMNEVLSILITEALVAPILKPERLIMEHIMLITILHANVGTEVGAHFLQNLVQKYDEMLKNNPDVENKQLDSIILMLSHLYNFKVIGPRLLYQILNQLSDNFREKEIELILLILKSVGFSLRKDDPLALKNLILNLQEKAATTESNNLRVKFMLETLLAIKNNNMNKIPQYDPAQIEHLKKVMKTFLRKGNSVSPFEIGLTDLLQANERGRWWIVGSAWTGKEDMKPDVQEKQENPLLSKKLLELARKQRMNTDSRKNIFCILMSAEDFMDAFEKLHRLGLKGQQARDIVYVIIDCCLQEKQFNPYYAVLAQKFCEFDRKYQITIQYALWDKLKELQHCTSQQILNLAQFTTHLFVEKGLPLSVLKVIQLTELDKYSLKFLQRVMLDILLQDNADTCLEVFARIAISPKLHQFRESLRLFINHFLITNLKKGLISDEQKNLLKQRASLVDKLLNARNSKAMF